MVVEPSTISPKSPPRAPLQADIAPRQLKLTIEKYHRMIAAGVFDEDEPIQLLDGELVHMPPINPRHASTVKRIARHFNVVFGDRALVGIQDPIHLSEISEPEPDVALLKPRADYYAEKHPTASDVLLIVEVADTSLEFDRETKGALYAQAGIAEYWLVNLVDGWVEVFRDPSPRGYRLARKAMAGEKLTLLAFPEIEIEREAVLFETRQAE